MPLTKADAQAAAFELDVAARMLDTLIPDKAKRDEVKRHLIRVDGFLEAVGEQLRLGMEAYLD